MLDHKEAVEIIRFKLSKQRFKHSVQVAVAARELAQHYGLNEDKAYLIGLLHDYAKGLSGEALLDIAEANNLIEDRVERQVPDLLHAPVGALLLQEELGIHDGEILSAVSKHTLGHTSMNTMDKIIFLADMIEPGRDYPGLERLRCLAYRNLDEGMLLGLDSTIKYCLDQERILHPRTVLVRNHYLEDRKTFWQRGEPG